MALSWRQPHCSSDLLQHNMEHTDPYMLDTDIPPSHTFVHNTRLTKFPTNFCNCATLVLCCILTAAVIQNMSIGLSSTTPLAGEDIRMTCFVVSSGPTTLTWIDPSGDKVTSNSQNITLHKVDGGLSVLFRSLLTSHGGVYTCIASVGGTQSAQNFRAQHKLTVQSKTAGIICVTLFIV